MQRRRQLYAGSRLSAFVKVVPDGHIFDGLPCRILGLREVPDEMQVRTAGVELG